MSGVEVLAVEVVQYASEGRQLLKPELIGQTAAARAHKSPRIGAPQRDEAWTAPEIIDLLNQSSAIAGSYGRRIVEWAEQRGNLAVEGNRGLTFSKVEFAITIPGKGRTVVGALNGNPSRLRGIRFDNLKTQLPFTEPARRRQLHDDLRPLTRVYKGDPEVDQHMSASLDELEREEGSEDTRERTGQNRTGYPPSAGQSGSVAHNMGHHNRARHQPIS